MFTPDIFDHTSPVYPGDRRGNLDCIECHQSDSQVATYTAAMYKPDCAGACHVYTDATLTTIKEARNGERQVSDSDF